MIDFKQSSTKTGLILLGSAAAGLLTGNSELVTVTIGESGAQLGGTIPMVAAMLIGLFDTVRREKG
ncbi:hypothetical protein RJ45_06140 [Photobacterium gaetbulicola]|uniref:Uncharacterized protein n=1 Tax=Photobacterium gaetbulicola TaxID=1295392 RepID=A0A0B9GI72_9GAMM|nr:hypothetical protein [Photobacterium gaetbulicola]KHT64485.1 hypothetical protein RJ45_06140 [Photobacterium gaetbulicola]